MSNSTDLQISGDEVQCHISLIKSAGWWQGAVISGENIPSELTNGRQSAWWIVTSQTCNLYHACFDKVPVVELVAASTLSQCHPAHVKGDNPRRLHVIAHSEDDSISLDVDIQSRIWIDRKELTRLSAPRYFIKDLHDGSSQNQWLDIFSAWLGRSYTRVALPDEFNNALEKSKIKDVLSKKLAKQKDALYGIYFGIFPDSDEEWNGALGMMPPPYLLEIKVVTHKTIDPEEVRKSLVSQLFVDQVENPDNKEEKISRALLANKFEIRILEAGITADSETEITLYQLKSLIRYSMVDHLSDSSMASPDP